MNKVIAINLNNNAFQLEEQGYTELSSYLLRAAEKLADNPDKDEIMADLEQAVADKAAQYLNPNKTVINTGEIKEIVTAMGPVEDVQTETAETAAPTENTTKRLFKIRDGAILEGVCNGLAAYLNQDVTVVRVGFIILTVMTGGVWIIAYILMAIFIPEARTAEDRATASGKPFNAQAVIAEARERYEYWKDFGKSQQKKWNKEEFQEDLKAKIDNKILEKTQKIHAKKWGPSAREIEQWNNLRATGSNAARAIAGGLGFAFVILLMALVVAWTASLVDIFTSGTILGYFAGESKIALALLVSCAFYLVFLPIQAGTADMLRYAHKQPSYSSFWAKFTATAIWLAAATGFIGIVMQSGIVREGFTEISNDYTNSGRIGR